MPSETPGGRREGKAMGRPRGCASLGLSAIVISFVPVYLTLPNPLSRDKAKEAQAEARSPRFARLSLSPPLGAFLSSSQQTRFSSLLPRPPAAPPIMTVFATAPAPALASSSPAPSAASDGALAPEMLTMPVGSGAARSGDGMATAWIRPAPDALVTAAGVAEEVTAGGGPRAVGGGSREVAVA